MPNIRTVPLTVVNITIDREFPCLVREVDPVYETIRHTLAEICKNFQG